MNAPQSPRGPLPGIDPNTLPEDTLGQTSMAQQMPGGNREHEPGATRNMFTRSYPDMAETHAGVVIFVGDRAYKMKKPVDLGFLDFRDLSTRAWACRRECELNRRLAPDVYLDVAELHDSSGEACEYFVVMQRMPAERSLAALIENGHPDENAVREVARMLADLHSRGPHSPEIPEGTPDALRGRWDEDLDALDSFTDSLLRADVVDELAHRALTFISGRSELLKSRVAQGRIVDGHGDLLAEDIFCLDDGPRVLDCIEFDDHLRRLDGADDAACLAMDLEYRGDPSLAERFLNWYRQFSADPAPEALLHHYTAYRALIRSKVACLKHVEGDPSTTTDAQQHLDIALDHARRAQVRLVLVGGLPGTGKSTLGANVADRLGAVLISSDQIRREMPAVEQSHSTGSYQSGPYAPENIDRTYAEMLQRASALLAHGESVILDASWTRQRHRQSATDAAENTCSELVELQCTAPDETVTRRLRYRHSSLSDADENIAAAMAADMDTWPQAHTVSTADSAATTRALQIIQPYQGI